MKGFNIGMVDAVMGGGRGCKYVTRGRVGRGGCIVRVGLELVLISSWECWVVFCVGQKGGGGSSSFLFLFLV